jgi:putative aldouronate transport system permease protein
MLKIKLQTNSTITGQNKLSLLSKDIKKNKYVYMMAVPVVIYYFIFHYMPIYGTIIAFKDFSPGKGIFDSAWVGLKHFENFFSSFYFWRLIKNTMLISVLNLIFGFPAPVILALLLNEVGNKLFKRSVQTVTYLPHFISLVVVAGIIRDFTASRGIINDIIVWLGGTRGALLQKPSLFRTIYISSEIWQHTGWGAIIYMAALAGIDQEQYEAAVIDGANRFRRLIHITIPGIMPTIVILFILRMGRMLSVGFEKIILLYNPAIYETADVISSFVYRRGLQEFDWSFSTAVDLFNSVINFILIVLANRISRKLNESSLW